MSVAQGWRLADSTVEYFTLGTMEGVAMRANCRVEEGEGHGGADVAILVKLQRAIATPALTLSRSVSSSVA